MIFIDFETYYDKDYSLKKMNPAEYVLDRRFQVLGMAYATDYGDPVWLDPEQIPAWLASPEFKAHNLVAAHNMQFDGMILAWHYGVVPRRYIDTLAVARVVLSSKLNTFSLDALGRYFGLPKFDVINVMSGVGLDAMRADQELYGRMKAYARRDVDVCRTVYRRLRDGLPVQEYAVVDMLLRMAICPSLSIDAGTCQKLIATEQEAKLAHVQDVAAIFETPVDKTRGILMSSAKLAAALSAAGFTVPMKVSPKTGKLIPAFAKTDGALQEMAERDEVANAIVEARYAVKSTLEETRAARYARAAELDWSRCQIPVPKNAFPVPLRYAAAHTHRFGGDWKWNVQNLGRGSRLRDAVYAPEGMVLIATDASQIEARILAYIAGADLLLDAFRTGSDPYRLYASMLYGCNANEVTPEQRFNGKTAVLGLGYGLGARGFSNSLRIRTGKLYDVNEVDEMIRVYREQLAPQVPILWRRANGFLRAMVRGGRRGAPADYTVDGVTVFSVNVSDKTIEFPGGLALHYNTLDISNDGDYILTKGGRAVRIFGAALVENIVQTLARLHITGVMVAVKAALELFPAGQVHDELWYVVPAEDAGVAEQINARMKAGPAWAPALPLDAETGIGRTYSEAKKTARKYGST